MASKKETLGQDDLSQRLKSTLPRPREGKESDPFESVGEWKLLDGVVWMREIEIAGGVCRFDFVTKDADAAREIATRLQETPSDLEIARKNLSQVSEKLARRLNGDGSEFTSEVMALIAAAKELERCFDQHLSAEEDIRKYEEWERRSRHGSARIRKDPKSAEKANAKSCAKQLWDERREGKHPKLRTVAQFATEVLRRWPVLQSHKHVCQWSTDWTKELRAARKVATKNPAS